MQARLISTSTKRKKGLSAYQEIVRGGKQEGHYSVDGENVRTNWISIMDCCLVELLQEKSWCLEETKLEMDLWSRLGLKWSDCSMGNSDLTIAKTSRHRYKHLRRQYNDTKVLLEQSHSSFDETGEMVIAEIMAVIL